MHGGKGGAPSGPRNGNYKHGMYTKERLQADRESIDRFRELMALAKETKVFDTVPKDQQLGPDADQHEPRFPPSVLK